MALALLVIAILLQFQVAHAQVAPSYCPKPTVTGSGKPIAFRPNPPRVFPLCIGKDPETNNWDPEIVNMDFDIIIDDINNKRHKDQEKKNWVGFIYDPPKDSSFPFRKTSKLLDPYYMVHVYKDYKLPPSTSRNAKIMSNWLVLDLYGLSEQPGGNKNVKGLYVQAFYGPLGIPFGEFVNVEHSTTYHFRPTRPPTITGQVAPPKGEFQDRLRMYPCTYFAKAGLTIPKVLLWSADSGYSGHDGKFTVVFKWDENSCAEVAYFQLIIIAVFDFAKVDYHVGLSNVLFPANALYPSTHGLAYPFYPDWRYKEVAPYYESNLDKLKLAHGVTLPAEHSYELRIVSNFEYEHCVQHHIGLVWKGPQKGACPPGPLKCDYASLRTSRSPADLKKRFDKIWEEWHKAYEYFGLVLDRPACPPPIIPTTSSTTPGPSTTGPTASTIETTTTEETTTMGSTTSMKVPPQPTAPSTTTRKPSIPDIQAVKQEKVAKRTEKAKVISHGDLCVFIWFVLVPVSNYLARFFKDYANCDLLGVGFWIVGHVIIHHTGVLLMWVGFGLVVSNGVSFFGGADALHYLFGFPAAIIQHAELFSGFIRDKKQQVAQRQSIMHAVLGYISAVFALCCAQFSRIDKTKSYLIYSMFACNVIAILIGTFIDLRVAKGLGMFPTRKTFPVMERIVMVNTKARCYTPRIAGGVLYVVVGLGLFAMYVSDFEFFK